MRPTRIPLFPLDVVLLPGAALPLHIFEPRYKKMIGRCIVQKLEFGMIYATGQNVAAIGCTAEIVQKMKQYPDGRMDILTRGRAPFRLLQLLQDETYHEGVVEYLRKSSCAKTRRRKRVSFNFSRSAMSCSTARPGWIRPKNASFRWLTEWQGGSRLNSNKSRRSSKCGAKMSAAISSRNGSRSFFPSSKSANPCANALRATATGQTDSNLMRCRRPFRSSIMTFARPSSDGRHL